MTFPDLSLESPVVRAADTATGEMGVVGARFIMAGGPSEGRFSVVEHPIVPRGLAAPVHVHRREDEFSFVLEGRWGFQLGVDVVYAEPGDLVYKPRDVWHTFWNATDEPARLLEIISPAGFEQLFVELADLLRTDPGNLEAAAALGPKYGVESDPEATARVVAEHGLIEHGGRVLTSCHRGRLPRGRDVLRGQTVTAYRCADTPPSPSSGRPRLFVQTGCLADGDEGQ